MAYLGTSATAISSSSVWIDWTDTSCLTASTNMTVWYKWSTSAGTSNAVTYSSEFGDYTRAGVDDAKVAAERADIARRAAEAEAVRQAARDKARALLHAMLEHQQLDSLQRQRFFEVVAKASGRRYRIYEGSHGNVRLVDEGGREVTQYCAQPNGVPIGDSMLAQKLQIEHDEAGFLRVANATRLVAR